jgi:hypothetical protein
MAKKDTVASRSQPVYLFAPFAESVFIFKLTGIVYRIDEMFEDVLKLLRILGEICKGFDLRDVFWEESAVIRTTESDIISTYVT